MSAAYAITLARSSRGRYHISAVKYPELALGDPIQGFEPVCRARADQAPQVALMATMARAGRRLWGAADARDTFRYFTERIHRDLTCRKCELL